MDLVCIQETRLKGISRDLVKSIGVGRFVDWVVVNAVEASRGILIFWDSRTLQLLGTEERQSTLSCKFGSCEDNFTWVFTGVYELTTKEGRDQLWDDLGAVRGLWGKPWCIGGDFNVTHFPNERNREGRILSSMRKFSQVIDELELKDLPLQGGSYTWKGGLNNQRMARLVRDEWEVHFGGVRQSLLPKPLSDHHPILLEGGGCPVRGPLPFRFENMWLKEEGFKNLINEWWCSLEIRGSGSYVLTKKLKAIKVQLKN